MINVLGLAAMDDREALANFLDALRIAEAAAKQMAFYTQRPQWLLVEKKLGDVREAGLKMAQAQLSVIRP